MKPFQKILAAVDFSEPSEQALQRAAEVSQRYAASLVLAHVYEPLAYAVPGGYTWLSEPQLDQLLAHVNVHMTHQQELAEAAGALKVETRLRHGFAADEICTLAGEEHFDLIVIGTHGRRGLSHLFMGSVAERVVRTAPCPVLSVRPAR